MAATASTGIVLEALTRDNYLNWSTLVKTYLVGKGLWDDIVEGTVNRRDENWKSKNGQALHAIQLSCGYQTLRQIRNCETAQEAWNHLKAAFSEDLKAEHDIEQGHGQNDLDQLHSAVKRGSWNDASDIIRRRGDIIFARSSLKGWTALHVAVAAGQENVMEELVKMVSKGGDGLLTKKIKADDGKGDIPVLLAAAKGHKEMTKYLFFKTRWISLPDNDIGYYHDKLLSHCIHAGMFGKS